jgi:hypothetical protein
MNLCFPKMFVCIVYINNNNVALYLENKRYICVKNIILTVILLQSSHTPPLPHHLHPRGRRARSTVVGKVAKHSLQPPSPQRGTHFAFWNSSVVFDYV